jgi:hypothetical protein
VGFDGIFWGRGDYEDKEKRLKERSMEFIWRGSKSLGSSAEVGYIVLYVSVIMRFYYTPHPYIMKGSIIEQISILT